MNAPSKIILRFFNDTATTEIYTAWKTQQNVCAVLPTGAGKTVLFGTIMAEHQGCSIAIAHRQELVGQMSLALASLNVVHSIIAPDATIRWIVRLHIDRFGRPFYSPSAKCYVAGVDTMMARISKPHIQKIIQKVTLWVTDECHHILRKNKWGKVVAKFERAKGLGVTATPERADGKGLGRGAKGVFDTIVTGPAMRELINQGYLSDYRLFCPPSNLDPSSLKLSPATGDYTRNSIVASVRKSSIMGNVINHYLLHAYGKSGLTFVSDVKTAYDIAAQFNAVGTRAEAIHAGTPDRERQSMLDRFRAGRIKQLVNVDLFGEGFDVPAVEVVSMARPTKSYGLYAQQFGRALRILDGKERAIIIDHANNVIEHKGPPDRPREWSLESRCRGKQESTVGIKICPRCTAAYDPYLKVCPLCGYYPKPVVRSAPEFVDGDLVELDPAALARLRGEKEQVDAQVSHAETVLTRANASPWAILGARKNHKLRQQAQRELRETIAVWAALQRRDGRSDSESYRRFYHTWGMDVLSAQALKKRDAQELNEKIKKEINI
jgi:superfamily II DNA or RNA helicase